MTQPTFAICNMLLKDFVSVSTVAADEMLYTEEVQLQPS